jgi:predicted nuclease with RNAse H fold
MRRKTVIVAMAVFGVVFTAALSARAETRKSVKGNAEKIVVEIDYGDVQPPRTAEVLSMKGKTVLEVLQAAAVVETHPVGQYVFVTSIDGVAGKRGETAWYYTIDGNSAKELAFSKTLKGNERVKWIYKKDVCSWKVDDNLTPPDKGGDQK